jgi:ATP diphosphatase
MVRKAKEYRRAMNPSQPDDTVNHGHDRGSHHLERVLDLVRFLRRNCPWDAAQTPQSLVPYLLEEAHEVADALADAGDTADTTRVAPADSNHLAAELGDLLLNVAFQIVLAEERGEFGAEEVVSAVETKMRRRHPHLYGDGEAVEWEELKRREREEGDDPAPSLLEGLPGGLDPLSSAHRIQDRVAAVGFDWENARGAFDKVAEELEEVREALEAEPSPALEEELGDLLFAVVNLSRLAGVHALTALRDANAKFSRRFNALEVLARERNVRLGEATLAELDALWDEVKQNGTDSP